MNAAELLECARARGVDLYLRDTVELRYRAARGALGPDLRAELTARREELVPLVAARSHLDRFLADTSISLAIFESRALGRCFVVARRMDVLEGLDEAERRLPVLTFADCEKLAGLGPADLSAILDVREEFGPSAELVAVGPRVG